MLFFLATADPLLLGAIKECNYTTVSVSSVVPSDSDCNCRSFCCQCRRLSLCWYRRRRQVPGIQSRVRDGSSHDFGLTWKTYDVRNPALSWWSKWPKQVLKGAKTTTVTLESAERLPLTTFALPTGGWQNCGTQIVTTAMKHIGSAQTIWWNA